MPHFVSDFMFSPAVRAHRVFALRAHRDPYTPWLESRTQSCTSKPSYWMRVCYFQFLRMFLSFFFCCSASPPFFFCSRGSTKRLFWKIKRKTQKPILSSTKITPSPGIWDHFQAGHCFGSPNAMQLKRTNSWDCSTSRARLLRSGDSTNF